MEIKKNHLEEAEKAKWQYRRGGEIICFGGLDSLPSLEERQRRREDGFEVYIDGKPEVEKGRKKRDS